VKSLLSTRGAVWLRLGLMGTALCLPGLAFAQDEPTLDSGNTAWMLVASALVLFMTIPGLSLFYGGLVRSRNVLSVLMQCFTITALATIIWVVCGYSLAFGFLKPRRGA
jgi:Amt family ammonium transporter